jgi:hypothetical protein
LGLKKEPMGRVQVPKGLIQLKAVFQLGMNDRFHNDFPGSIDPWADARYCARIAALQTARGKGCPADMDLMELQRVILPGLEKAIKFSLLNNLNIHTSVGAKFAELYVASELWEHEPKLGQQRGKIKEVKHPASCDVVLAKTGKKLEVKWAVFHYIESDPFVKRSSEIPFWGCGFSGGKQFKDKKFDYLVLIAAERDGAHPEHIFVIKCEEMTEKTMGGLRRSSVFTKGSFYIEFSHDKDFYYKRKWHPKGPSPLEEDLFKNSEKYEKRWKELKEKGAL